MIGVGDVRPRWFFGAAVMNPRASMGVSLGTSVIYLVDFSLICLIYLKRMILIFNSEERERKRERANYLEQSKEVMQLRGGRARRRV